MGNGPAKSNGVPAPPPRGWFTFLDGRKEDEKFSQNRWADPVLSLPEGDFHRGGQGKGAFYFKPETVSVEPTIGSKEDSLQDSHVLQPTATSLVHAKPAVVLPGKENTQRKAGTRHNKSRDLETNDHYQ